MYKIDRRGGGPGGGVQKSFSRNIPILCFDLLPLQYTDLTYQIWRFLVWSILYVFLIFLDLNYIMHNCLPWTHGDLRVHLYANNILFGLETIYEDDIMIFISFCNFLRWCIFEPTPIPSTAHPTYKHVVLTAVVGLMHCRSDGDIKNSILVHPRPTLSCRLDTR